MIKMRPYLILLALLTFSLLAKAQISEGGTPISLQPAYGLGLGHIPVQEITAPSAAYLQQLEAEDVALGKNPRIGVLLPTNLTTDNSGEWQVVSKGGDRVWRLRVSSQDALGLTLYWNDFHLPEGAKLYVFSPDLVEVYGAFTSANNDASGLFVTQLVHMNEVIIEYFEPAEVLGQGRFTISDVGYAWRQVKSRTQGLGFGRDFGDSGACEVNINCSPEGDNWQDEKRGVCRYLSVVGGFQGWCTGTMVNNVRQNCTPYFLTAWHCGEGVTQANLNQWVFYFNYEAPSCPNPANGNNLPNNTVTGASMRANSNDGGGNTGSDFLLVQLNQTPPAAYNVYYCGWNATGVANTGGVCINHPAGDIKKVTTYTGTLISATWGGAVQNTHWTANWVATPNGNAVTEGGSSGSALYDNNGRIVGTLTGGPSNCNAAQAQRNDQYGKVSYHWQSNGNTTDRQLKPWLDPDNTGALTLDGVYAPCTGFTVSANPTAIVACAGTNPTTVITVAALGGFNTPVNLSAAGAAGATYQFSTNPVTPGNTSTMTISGLAAGTYNITVTGTAGATNQTVVLQVTVAGAVPGVPVLTTPVNAANGVANSPTLNWNAIAGATYTVQVATDAAFTNIVATATGLAANSWTVTPALAQNTTYFWRVRAVNGCGNGNFATAFTFTTGSVNCVTVNSTNVPVNISANGTPTVTSTLTFPNSGSITDVNVVALSGTHTYIQDLTFTLTSPSGIAVTLLDQVCGSENDFSIQFNDGAAPGAPPCPPTNGQAYQPNQPLSGFNGLNPLGTWTLTIVDNANQDGGALQAWGIEICYVGGGCALTTTIASTNITCNGAANGTATANAANGTAPYFYAWNNGATTQALSNLAPGAYSVTVTDANSCTATASVSLTQPGVFNVSFNITNTPAGACTGALTANTTGGGGGALTYLWSNGATTQIANNLCAGSYSVTVTNANGCTVSGTATVNTQVVALTATATATPASCFGTCNGSATVTAAGGVLPYTYAWPNGQTAATATNLCAGSFTVTVTGGNGSTATATATVAQPAALAVSVTPQAATTLNPPCDGTAAATATGGTAPYTYAWSNGGNGAAATGLCGNQAYTLTVTDANGCTTTSTFTVPFNVGLEQVPGLSAFTLSPNPNAGHFFVEVYFDQLQQDAALEIYNATGQLLNAYPLNAVLNRQEISLEGYPAAVYFVRLKTAQGTAVKPVLVR